MLLRLVLGYLAVVGMAFLAGYAVLDIRELGLYLFLMVLNLPGSVAVVPQMESFSQSVGWTLGDPLHIWATQLACMAVNGALFAFLLSVVFRLWGFFRRRRAT